MSQSGDYNGTGGYSGYDGAGYDGAGYYSSYYYGAEASGSGVDPAYYDPSYTFPLSGYNSGQLALPPVVSVPLGYDQGSYVKPEDPKADRKGKRKRVMRSAAGQVWEDPTLAEWEENDFRLFAGDLGNEVNDDMLKRAFEKYPSFTKAKVIKEKRSEKSKGYGFVSFKDASDFVKAWKEMNGKYVGNRPIKLRKSTWKDRAVDPKAPKAKKYS